MRARLALILVSSLAALAAPGVARAQSAPPSVAGPSAGPVHQHGGFFGRVQLGVGETFFTIAGAHTSPSSTGLAGSFALGAAVTPHVILFAEIFGASPAQLDGAGSVSLDGGAGLTGLGGGAAYCLTPMNGCISGTLGAASVSFSGALANGRATATSDNGVAFKLGLSQEWWIANQVGIGFAFQLIFTGDMRDSVPVDDIARPAWSATSFALLFSVTGG